MKHKKCRAAVSGQFFKLHGTVALLTLACTAAPMASFADEYIAGTTPEIVLMTGSEDGTTNTLSEAIAAYNKAHETDYDVSSFNGGDLADYAIVKEGDGTLVMDTAIQSFTGPIVIKDGVVKCMERYTLGADETNSFTHVYVREGATLWVNRVLTADGKSDAPVNSYRVLHVAGTGHNGQGAVLARNTQTSYNYASIYGKEMYLDDDAMIYHPVWAYITKDLYLNGKTLTVGTIYKSASKGATDAIWVVNNIYGAGKIILDDSVMHCGAQGYPTLNDASEGNEFVMADGSGIRLVKSYFGGPAKNVWPLRFTGPKGWLWGDCLDTSMRFDGPRNSLYNPIVLENGVTIDMRLQWGPVSNWVKLHGPVSGTGNFNLAYVASQAPKRLSLVNPENSFSGTVTVDKGIVFVYEPGSLPAGNPVVVSRSKALDAGLVPSNTPIDYHGVEFVAPGEQNLGPLTFTSVADSGTYHSGRIQGGSGNFSRIDKLSPNTMEYYSGVGSPFLNVEGGTVKLPRGPAPGLWEGTNNTQNAGGQSGNASWAFKSTATSTNLVARGPNVMNNTFFAHYGAPLSNGRINVYDGYIWNRETTNVTWTFATAIGQYACVYVDGEQVVYYSYISDSNHTSPAHQFNQVTLTPGPHSFQVRTCCGTVRGGGSWPLNFGFAYDKFGRTESGAEIANVDTNNFEIVLDPGDGSLLTRSIDESDLPHFGDMHFAEGTTLDVNGNAYIAPVVSGWPTVVSTAEDPSAEPSLTITNSFIVNAVDLAGENPPKMTVTIPLSFGETGGVMVTNLANLTYGHYTIAEVTGEGNEITISRDSTPWSERCVFDVGNRWAVNLSADGKILTLDPQAGMKIFLK